MSRSPDAWTKLLSLTVHEFRTPLTIISGYVRMLASDRLGPVSDQQRHVLEETERACGRLSSLVAELSELANLEAGTATFNRHDVAVFDLVEQAVAAARAPDQGAAGVDLRGGGEAIVHGDPVRLRRAFAALLHATAKEAIEGGTTIVDRRTVVDGGRREALVIIAHERVYPSLAWAALDRLEPFDPWRGGLGLGLVIAARVIEAHGGRLAAPPDQEKLGVAVWLPAKGS